MRPWVHVGLLGLGISAASLGCAAGATDAGSGGTSTTTGTGGKSSTGTGTGAGGDGVGGLGGASSSSVGGMGGVGVGGAGGAAASGGTGGMGTGGMGTGGMGTGGMGTGGLGDVTPPSVVSVSPSDGTSAVMASPTLGVVFSEAMSPSTITTSSNTSCTGSMQISSDGFTTCVPLTSPTSGDGVTFSFAPTAPLASATSYALRVTTAAQDAAGNSLASMFQTSTGFTVRYAHTVVIDGVNDFTLDEAIATSTVGGQLYASHDDTTLYLGLAHPDVQIGGTGNKFVYFLLSADPNLMTGNSLSSDGKAKFGAAGTAALAYHWKIRIDGASYEEYRIGNGSDWSTDWLATGKSSFRAAGFVEGSIALSELGNPSQVVITAYTVDYDGDNGNGWLYNMIAGATDGSGLSPRDVHGYLLFSLPTSAPPSDPSQQISF
ncbi:MAG: Ig-like domain-containing protein [Myxococcales bacterium]|nr:Ig-like domain-containing protein [Myxococcales bacterium]